MQNPRLAGRYAKSLLDLAVEQNSLEPTLKDMQLLEAICKQSREFTNVLRSPVITGDKKQNIVDAVIGEKLSTLVKAFVTLLINKGREGNLPEIASAFVAQYKEQKNIRTIKVTTAAPMTDDVKQAIHSKVVATVPNASAIEITEEVNPDLIGGFVLQMDDKLFDASILRDLKDVKAQFLKNIYVSQI